MSHLIENTVSAANCSESVLRAMQGYEPALSTIELDEALRRLLAFARRCERLVCRYLADLADRPQYGEVGWFSDVLDYAQVRLGLGVKATRERCTGRAKRGDPKPVLTEYASAGRFERCHTSSRPFSKAA